VDNLLVEVQQLQAENARLCKENTTVALEIDIESRLRTEVENADREIAEICQGLHKAQEEQALCEDKLVSLTTLHKECCEKNQDLKEHILKLNNEVSCANKEWESI